ncbi:MAG: type II toxin-antitoxin system VapC family toxin [Sphingomonas sp.]
MILVDTSVWADHFRRGEPVLGLLLREARIMIHPFVIGELALGDLRPRDETVASLCELPQAPVTSQDTFLSLVATEALATTGIGFVDAHLLLSAARNPGLRLWTRDKRLAARAEAMGIGWAEPIA